MTITVEPRIYRSDMVRSKLERLTPARPTTGTITFNDDMKYKRELALSMIAPDSVRALADFLYVELVLSRSDGTRTIVPCGHYLVMDPETQDDGTSRTGTIRGRDITYMLDRATMDGPYVVEAGADPVAAARDVIRDMGIPAAMVVFPDVDIRLTSAMRWPGGTSRLDIANDLLNAGGCYQVWPNGEGTLLSQRYRDLATARPDVVLGGDSDLRILTGITSTYDPSRLRNQVTVRRVAPGEDDIEATVTVTDLSSPVHPEVMQQRMGAGAPVIWGEVFEDHTVQTVEEAERRAKSLLSENASWYRVMRASAFVDPHPDGHQVIAFSTKSGHYDGTWWRRTWTIRLDGPEARIECELNRTEAWL